MQAKSPKALPAVLRKAATRDWRRRWATLVLVTVQSALAATLVDDGTSCLTPQTDQHPCLSTCGSTQRQRGHCRHGRSVTVRTTAIAKACAKALAKALAKAMGRDRTGHGKNRHPRPMPIAAPPQWQTGIT
jgi:hypothetical protein